MSAVGDPRDELPVDEDRTDEGEVVEMCPPLVRIVDGELGPGLDVDSESVEHRCDRRWHRTEVDGDVLCLSEHLAGRIEQRRGAVRSLLDVR